MSKQQHFLKTIPKHFDSLTEGKMTAQVRFNDRNFKAGDELLLAEFTPGTQQFSGNMIKRVVSKVQGPDDLDGLAVGYVLLSHSH